MAATSGTLVSVEAVGLRDLKGRFATQVEGGLMESQRVAAKEIAEQVQAIYRKAAPHGTGDSGEHFFEGIEAKAESGKGAGFRIELTVRNADLRRWLKEGTGLHGPRGQRIYPANARALGPIFSLGGVSGGPWYFASIAGMKPNPWEDRAFEEARPLAVRLGNQVSAVTAARLAGD